MAKIEIKKDIDGVRLVVSERRPRRNAIIVPLTSKDINRLIWDLSQALPDVLEREREGSK
jgi:hypothetical protein